jgi:branched-subunit amino acid transport protein AzlD
MTLCRLFLLKHKKFNFNLRYLLKDIEIEIIALLLVYAVAGVGQTVAIKTATIYSYSVLVQVARHLWILEHVLMAYPTLLFVMMISNSRLALPPLPPP